MLTSNVGKTYNNRLVYCRPIRIRYRSVFLTDFDVVQLANEKLNIAMLFLQTLKNKCATCNTLCEESNSVEFPCGCKICFKCNIKKINRATNDLVILNFYEKSKFIT